MDVKFFKCMHCGNVAIKPFDQGVPMSCCGEKMVELRANDTDGAKEKHVPQVVVDGSTVHVKVGEVAHPMTPEHLVAFIVLVTEKGYQIAPLTAQDAPEATFALAAGDAPVQVTTLSIFGNSKKHPHHFLYLIRSDSRLARRESRPLKNRSGLSELFCLKG